MTFDYSPPSQLPNASSLPFICGADSPVIAVGDWYSRINGMYTNVIWISFLSPTSAAITYTPFFGFGYVTQAIFCNWSVPLGDSSFISVVFEGNEFVGITIETYVDNWSAGTAQLTSLSNTSFWLAFGSPTGWMAFGDAITQAQTYTPPITTSLSTSTSTTATGGGSDGDDQPLSLIIIGIVGMFVAIIIGTLLVRRFLCGKKSGEHQPLNA